MLSEFRDKRKNLENVWAEGRIDDQLLRDHSRLVDSYIVNCFLRSEVDDCGGDLAFVALGGYGRE